MASMTVGPGTPHTPDTPGAITDSRTTSPSTTTESPASPGFVVWNQSTLEPLETAPLNSGPKKGENVRYELSEGWLANTVGNVYVTNLSDQYGQWRSVPGIPAGKLLVSSQGWVIMSDRHVWCKPTRGWMQKGYFHVFCHWHAYQVARLICRAFNGPQPTNAKVIHLAGKTNNEAALLQWGTPSQARLRQIEDTPNYVSNQAIPVYAKHISWDASSPTLEFRDYKAAASFFNLKPNQVGIVVRDLERDQAKPYATMGVLTGWFLGKRHGETQDDLPATSCDRMSGKPEPAEEWKLDPVTNQKVSNRGRVWRSHGRGLLGKSTPMCNGQRAPLISNNFHRMIYRAWHNPDISIDDWVMHVDSNKANNNLSNLRCEMEATGRKGIKRRREDLVGIRREHAEVEWKFASDCDSEIEIDPVE